MALVERRKKMNNKGFTLIELLITIALLSIISLISFVAINKIIEQSKVKNCESLVSNIKSVATEYVSDYRYDSDFIRRVTPYASNNGYTVDITAATLITNNYLKGPIVNPFTNELIHDGSGNTPNETAAIKVRLYLNSDYTVNKSDIFIDGTYPNLDFILTCKK